MSKPLVATEHLSEATHNPSPSLLIETLTAYQRSEALQAAIELDIFSAISDGATSAELLAKHCGAAVHGVRILSDYLVISGFLTKKDGRYGLTPDSAVFLNRKSPLYAGTVARFFCAEAQKEQFKNLIGAVRKGSSVTPEGFFGQEHSIWVEYARGLAPLVALPAELAVRHLGLNGSSDCKVLDIAAGHGLFGIAIARHNPQAEVFAIDWPNVLDVALENAQKAQVAERYHSIPGDAFNVDFGTDYDVVVIGNFLHAFDAPTCERLLRRVSAALKPGGVAAAIEFVPNDDRVSPPLQASIALPIMVNTEAGALYTRVELELMFRHAGFSTFELRDLAPAFHQLAIARK